MTSTPARKQAARIAWLNAENANAERVRALCGTTVSSAPLFPVKPKLLDDDGLSGGECQFGNLLGRNADLLAPRFCIPGRQQRDDAAQCRKRIAGAIDLRHGEVVTIKIQADRSGLTPGDDWRRRDVRHQAG
jgi:hypothetical protein